MASVIKYSTTTFSTNNPPIKLRQLKRDLPSYYYWLQRHGYDWTAMNVYNRQTGVFVMQLTPSNYFNKLNQLP